jgi:ligand-binding sensor domain-containing protein
MDIFQKLEKVILGEKIKIKKELLVASFFLFSFSSSLNAQVDSRFSTFDWTIFSKVNEITSISEGYSHIYFAGGNAGILRFNRFSKRFDIPLTRGQGFKSERVQHVYFDSVTGILWLVGNKLIENTQFLDSNWNSKSLSELGINNGNQILGIGSSENFIWLNTSLGFLKIDHISGSLLGNYPYPDSKNINWGNISARELQFLEINFDDYFIRENWMLTKNGAYDQSGNFRQFLSYFEDSYGNLWIGLEDGYILYGEESSKNISILKTGICCEFPQSLVVEDNKIWLSGVSKSNFLISIFDKEYDLLQEILSERYQVFNNHNFYSSLKVENELWFGGDSQLLIYDISKDQFSEINEFDGVPIGKINSLKILDNHIWVLSSNGIAAFDRRTKKQVLPELSSRVFRSNALVGDMEIIGDDIYLIMNYKIFIFNKGSSGFQEIDLNSDSLKTDKKEDIFYSKLFFTNSKRIFLTQKGIFIFEDNYLIPNSTFFGKKVFDILSINDSIFIALEDGLMSINLNDYGIEFYYQFDFLKSIVKLYEIDNKLVLLSDSGLISFNF